MIIKFWIKSDLETGSLQGSVPWVGREAEGWWAKLRLMFRLWGPYLRLKNDNYPRSDHLESQKWPQAN